MSHPRRGFFDKIDGRRDGRGSAASRFTLVNGAGKRPPTENELATDREGRRIRREGGASNLRGNRGREEGDPNSVPSGE